MPTGLFHTNYQDDEKIFHTLWVKIWMGALLLFLFVGFPFVASPLSNFFGFSLQNTVNMIGIFIIGAHGLNLLTGFTGQISLGNSFCESRMAFLALPSGSRTGNGRSGYDLRGSVSAPAGALPGHRHHGCSVYYWLRHA